MSIFKYWQKFIQKPVDGIASAAFLIAITSLASRFLGVLRDRILAGSFGASESLDIYYAAFRVPDLLYSLLVLGALSAGFIPIFSSLIKEKDRKKAWYLANNTLNILVIFLAIISLISLFFVSDIVNLISPGFSIEAKKEAARLTSIMFLSPILLGISSVVGGVLQSFKRFVAYSLAPVFYNLGIIFGAVFLVDRLGLSGLAWGVVLGATFHMLIQLLALKNLKWHFQFIIDLKDKTLRRLTRLMIPRTLSLAVGQLNLIVITIIASNLTSGSLSVFNLANNLQSLPIGLFGLSFAIAAFPALSQNINNNDNTILIFNKTIRKILFFVVPATVFLITLRAQIVRVILGTGNFSWPDTILTMDALAIFSLSLFAQATIHLLVRIFYAKEDSLSPFLLGLLSVAMNLILALYLSPIWGILGLVLAFSIASIFQFVVLFFALHLKLGSLKLSSILSAVFVFSLASIFSGIAIQFTKTAIWPFINMSTFIGVATQLIISSLSGILVYLLICYWLQNEELLDLLKIVKQKLSFKKLKAFDSGEARGL
jgi:putative peptidoglycan lipid II flippase